MCGAAGPRQDLDGAKQTNKKLHKLLVEVRRTYLASPIDANFLEDAAQYAARRRGGAHAREHLRCLIVQWHFLARVSEIAGDNGKAAGGEIVGPQCAQKRVARRARSSAAEADMDEFRAGIHNDRGFGNDFRSERGQAL